MGYLIALDYCSVILFFHLVKIMPIFISFYNMSKLHNFLNVNSKHSTLEIIIFIEDLEKCLVVNVFVLNSMIYYKISRGSICRWKRQVF
jgi:hypothetical protein